MLLFAAIVTEEKWFRPVSNVALGILLVIFPGLITNQITMIKRRTITTVYECTYCHRGESNTHYEEEVVHDHP